MDISRSLVAFALLFPAIAACSSTPDEEAAPDQGAEALANGRATGTHPEVGRVELKAVGLVDAPPTHCVGTLVAPTVVLTTRSCAFGSLVSDGGTFFVDSDTDHDGKIDQTHRFAIKYGAALRQLGSKYGTLYFAKLAASVPTSLATAAPMRRAKLADMEKVFAIGYGREGTEGWGAKNWVSFPFHYATGLAKDDATPHVLNDEQGDLGSAALDVRGQLVAVAVSAGSTNWFFEHPDNWEELSDHFDRIDTFVKELSAQK